MGFWSIFKSKKDKSLTRLSGRGSCSVCDRILENNIYQVPNSKKYFCRKHAKEELEKPIIAGTHSEIKLEQISEEQTKEKKDNPTKSNKRNKYKGCCEFCEKKIPDPFDRFYCKYCGKWFCQTHRIPEDHKCANPKKASGYTSSTISYKR